MNGGWEEIDECFDTPFASTSILDDPRKIYEYLRSKVYKQDEACKAAAMILYNHVHKNIFTRNAFCGPSGSGKTYIWDIIKQNLYPYVIIVDASSMTKMGWSGSNKISSPLYQINPSVRAGYIIVYDEFDKLCKPQYSHDENVSASIQSELLALIQPSNEFMRLKCNDGKERTIRVDNLSFVFCGSFHYASMREMGKECSSGLGFGAIKMEAKAFDKELTMQTLIDGGVIEELASRITRIVNIRPLGESDYEYLINNHNNSPVNRIEDMYGLERGFIKEKVLREDELNQIATDAFKSGLGVRSVTSSIQRKVDDYIFEHFDHMHYID